MGGAEPFLATNRCKTPTYILKNCFENLEFLIPPVGWETCWVKNQRRQWWRKREHKEAAVAALAGAVLSPHTGSCWGAQRGLPSGPGPLGAQLWPLLFGLCEGNWKQSTTLSQSGSLKPLGHTLDTHAGEQGPSTSPRAESTRENQMLPTQRQLTVLACYGPPSRGTHTITTAFSPKRDTYS